MLIKYTVVSKGEEDVFRTIGVRDLGRETGLDIAYLSRVKNNKIAITLKRYLALWEAAEKFHGLAATPKEKG
jgi:hypothetical protein